VVGLEKKDDNFVCAIELEFFFCSFFAGVAADVVEEASALRFVGWEADAEALADDALVATGDDVGI